MIQFLIITSSEDKASMNIRERFLNSKVFKFVETNFIWYEHPVFKLKGNFNDNEIFIGLTKEPLIFLNALKLDESGLNPDLLIFASRHTSKSTKPAFLVHTTGNWTNNVDFGGDPQQLSKTSAILLKSGFLSLIEQEFPPLLSNFSLDIEVTHHGPTKLEKPLIFMELGSSKEEWVNGIAGELLAKAIIVTIFKYLEFNGNRSDLVGLGFGGTHYAPNFHRLIRNKNVAMSFICPKYYVQQLNKDLISKMIKNTQEKVDFFIVDWKGTNSEDKKHLIPLLEEFEIPIKKTKEF
ncbi:MAG: D-aminoacyl-tRNA deacylase [Promethearchaeota archaeon]